MSTVVLRTATRGLTPLLVAASLYLLLRGHQAVGGGFIGALVGGAAMVLRSLASEAGEPTGRPRLRFDLLLGTGLLLAVAVGVAGLAGGAFLAVGELVVGLPGGGELKLTSSLVFDIAVYLVVVGTVAALVAVLGPDRNRAARR